MRGWSDENIVIKIQSYKEGICWWCGKLADSQEHRHKKSDVKHIFGNKFEGNPIIIRDNYQKEIQGPNSKLLKFDNVLCQVCNNKRSQPFDKAYVLFVNYVLKNYENILDKGIIDLNNIVKTNIINFKHNIFRYFTKFICCRLASNNISIDKKLLGFLNNQEPLNFLYFKFELRPDIYSFLNRDGVDEYEGNIYLSPLKYFLSEDQNNINLVYQFYNLQWFRIYTFYSETMTNENYAGFQKYNDSHLIPIESKYSIHPDKLFDQIYESGLKKKEDGEWLEEYLDYNIFIKY